MITELHQEMSLKDQDKLGQLQQLVRLETTVKELTQELQSSAQTIAQLRLEARESDASNSVLHRDVSCDPAAARGLELLKSELTHRDACIQKLQRDLLLSHQARDSQSAQLDVQEQRLWELQRELQEKQQEQRRGHNRLQKLNNELQSTTRNTEELQGQLREVRTRLVQVEAENEALLGYKRLHTSEVDKLSAKLSSIQRGSEEDQETQRKLRELQAELSATRTHLSDCQDQTQEAQKRADEQIQQLQAEVSRLKLQHQCVNEQEHGIELLRLQKAHAELQVRDKECQRELNRIREELHNATLRAEEQRLKEVQIDELQREVDRMLALLEKDREDGSQAEEVERLQDEQLRLKDKLDKQEEHRAALSLEVETLRQKVRTHVQEVADLSQLLISSQDALQQVTGELKNCQTKLREWETEREGREQSAVELEAELNQLQHQYPTCYPQLVESEALVSCLRTDLQQAEVQRSTPVSQLHEQQQQLCVLKEKERSAQQECESQQKVLSELRAEVQRCDQEAQGQRENQEREVQGLRSELREGKSVLYQHRLNLERLHRELEVTQSQHGDVEKEVSRKEAALRFRDSELSQLKAELLEARRSASDAEARLKPLSESVQLYKQKHQTCVSKIIELESILQSHEQDQRQSRAQAIEREEQVVHLQAEIVALRDDLEQRCAQLESKDEALTALSRRLRDTQNELELSYSHTQKCELVISSLRDSLATLRNQVEEKEEAILKLQSDFSIYRATHMHSESDFESQICRIRELEQSLARALEHSGTCQSELQKLKDEVQVQKQLRDGSLVEVRRLQESMRKLQADAVCQAQSRQADMDALELRVNELEEQLEAARRKCVQKEQTVKKRDTLLRQSEADLIQAREKIRGKAAEAERHAATIQTLHVDLRQAKKEKREIENQCGVLHTQLLQVRDELKEAQSSCRDSVQKLARHEEKVLLLEGGHQQVQEQLAEQVAEVIRAENVQRRLHAELRRVQQTLESSEQELHDCRTQLEQVKLDATSSRQAQLGAQQEVLRLQHENQGLQKDLWSTKESFTHVQEQLKGHSVTVQALRLELAQEHARQQEQLDWVQRTRQREDRLETEKNQLQTDLETIRNQLQERLCELRSTTLRLQEEEVDKRTQLHERNTTIKTFSQELAECHQEISRLQQQLIQKEEMITELSTELQQLRSQSRISQDKTLMFEGRLAALNGQLAHAQHWGQQQLVTLKSREEELVLLKVELASLRENYCSKTTQMEAVRIARDSIEQKYSVAVSEVEVLRQALVDARTDTSRLHRESELVVTNVSQWVKEQKQANEKQSLKIRDQSQKIIHITVEKNHLQEYTEKLQAEIRRLGSELDEQRMEAKGCKAVETQTVNEQLHGHQSPALRVLTSSHHHVSENLSHQHENVGRKRPLVVRPDRS